LSDERRHILLTIDVEDWFQVENFKQFIPFSSWPRCELRVEKNTHRILDLLDSTVCRQSMSPNAPSETGGTQLGPPNPRNPRQSPKATFFVLGWIAERLPQLVCEIRARGHEVASHGFHHRLCRKKTDGDLKRDLMKSKKLLENLTGLPVYGFRAPSFSISNDVLKLIEDCGYLYDSSFNYLGMNERHGKIELTSNGRRGIAF
jgi:hypothetical protein